MRRPTPPDRSAAPAEGAATIVPIQNGTNYGFAVVTQETTERKQYERTLGRQNDRPKEFTDILSHDLRTPLTAVDARVVRGSSSGARASSPDNRQPSV